MISTANLNITGIRKLIRPSKLKSELPISEKSSSIVEKSRGEVQKILSGKDNRFLGIVGPCSIHEPKAALEYANRLLQLADSVKDHILLLMRVYFEKPRTSIGWRGMILDPYLDGSYDIETGLRSARTLLRQITELGLGTATEVLDPIVPQYISDLVSWAAVGARTTESQTHREMASGLSMPVGFKNSTDGQIDTAIQAIISSAHPRSFIGIDDDGETAVLTTKGNPWGHLILRGGKNGPNFAKPFLDDAWDKLSKEKLNGFIMVDCSHANSAKDHRNQAGVFHELVNMKSLHRNPGGFMLESNLFAGNQSLSNLSKLQYGVSITDSCIGWEETESLIQEAARLLRGH